jgi:hypothetical protein
MVIRLIFDPVHRMELTPDVNNLVLQTDHSHKPEKGGPDRLEHFLRFPRACVPER